MKKKELTKMKCFASVVILVLFLQACKICQISYKTKAELNKQISPLSKDSLMMTCGLVSTDHKHLHLLVRFYGEVKQQRVNAVNLTVTPNDKANLALEKVSSIPLKYANETTFVSMHTAKNFALLPDDYKLTSSDKRSIYYDFDYTSDKSIVSNSLDISLEIELQNGRVIRFRDDFKVQKNCYYSIH